MRPGAAPAAGGGGAGVLVFDAGGVALGAVVIGDPAAVDAVAAASASAEQAAQRRDRRLRIGAGS
jgi:hypothetical protein